jgi:serine/threonine protein kinase
MQKSSTLSERYSYEELLGSGGFGNVYKAISLSNSETFALKTDKKRKGNVRQEAELLLELQNGEGIPKVFEVGETEDYSYMLMTLLGASLGKFQKDQGGRLSIDLVVSVLSQALKRLEFIHSQGVVHRDLKPQQFLFGPRDILFLVDFGLARKFRVDGQHVPFQNHCFRAGNSTYASLNNHQGIQQTRRDDVESWAYMAVGLFKGRLPWRQSSKIPSSLKWDRVFSIKSSIHLHDLCSNCPKVFIELIKYARSLSYDECPDYKYLARLLDFSTSSDLLGPFLEVKKKRKNRRETSIEAEDKETSTRKVFILTQRSRNNLKY